MDNNYKKLTKSISLPNIHMKINEKTYKTLFNENILLKNNVKELKFNLHLAKETLLELKMNNEMLKLRYNSLCKKISH